MSDCNKGDFISRTALLQEFETEYACHNTELWHITGIKAYIENQPTVYAVEKLREAKAIDEFSKALIGRLEGIDPQENMTEEQRNVLNYCIEIVNEFAEEHKRTGLEGRNEYEYDRE